MQYCLYYQAQINKKKCSFVVAILRSMEHLCFDRTIDTKNNTFEFFVPEKNETHFLKIMDFFENANLITNFQKMENRLIK